MSKCKYCGVEGEWQPTQYGNRLFVNGQQHKCPEYAKYRQQQQATAPAPKPASQFAGRETSTTYVPQGYIQQNQEQQPQLQQMLETRLKDIELHQIDIEGFLAKINQKLDLLLSASVEDALGPKPMSGEDDQ